MKILIADDSSVYRKAITLSLKKWGHEVVQASDGDEALKLLRSPEAPSLAILDWMMPGINGTDICRAIRRDEYGSFKYILLLTSRESKEDIADLFYNLFDLKKGSTPEEITAFVRNRLRKDFVSADIGMTGSNYLIADTGSVALTENEGNGMMSISFPKIHIAIVGI